MKIEPVPEPVLASAPVEELHVKKVKRVTFIIPEISEMSESSETSEMSETSEVSETSETSEMSKTLEISDHDAKPCNESIRLVFMIELHARAS